MNDEITSNHFVVGDFSNKAPILRNFAQQDEPGTKYFVCFFITVFKFYCKIIHYLPDWQIKKIK